MKWNEHEIKKMVKNGVTAIGKCTDAIIQFKAFPSPLGAVAIGCGLISEYLEEVSKGGLGPGWKILRNPGTYRFGYSLRQFFDSIPGLKRMELDSAGAVVFEVDGFSFAFHETGCSPFIKSGVPSEEAWSKLSEIIWSLCPEGVFLKDGDDSIEISSAPAHETFDSAIAQNLFQRLTFFRQNNMSRAILLWGPPGSGKTSVCRKICSQLGGRSFHIFASDVRELRQDIAGIASVMRPDAVIFEDIDRTEDTTVLLEVLDSIKARCPGIVVLASANRTEGMDHAIFRPQRFDEVYYLDKIHDANAKLLQDFPPEIAEKLRPLTIAYIKEFHTLVRVFGLEAATTEIPRLFQAYALSIAAEQAQDEASQID